MHVMVPVQMCCECPRATGKNIGSPCRCEDLDKTVEDFVIDPDCPYREKDDQEH